MAKKQYYAVNKIVHGMGDAGEKVFNPGDLVTGLKREEMVALWEAGVLREFDPDATEPDARDSRIAQLEAELSALKAAQAEAAVVAASQEGSEGQVEQKLE